MDTIEQCRKCGLVMDGDCQCEEPDGDASNSLDGLGWNLREPQDSRALLDAIRKAWKEYNEMESDYTYHLEEGGDSDYTREDVSNELAKLDALM